MTPFLMLILAGYSAFILVLGFYSLSALVAAPAERRVSVGKDAAHPVGQRIAE